MENIKICVSGDIVKKIFGNVAVARQFLSKIGNLCYKNREGE